MGLHFELSTHIERFCDSGISDEEWALLQVHMAYCADSQRAFVTRQAAGDRQFQPNNRI